MAMDPSRAAGLPRAVDEALQRVRQLNYQRTRQDVLNLLMQSPFLEVGASPYPPPYGPVTLQIRGTITTYYRGSAYQTPLLIFVPPQFPSVPPIIQLNPTPDMAYDPRCPSINENGRVVHPCVNLEWRQSSSSLAECIAVLASAFGDGGVPPLRAADPGLARPPPQQQQPQPYPGPVGGAAAYPAGGPYAARPGRGYPYPQPQPGPPVAAGGGGSVYPPPVPQGQGMGGQRPGPGPNVGPGGGGYLYGGYNSQGAGGGPYGAAGGAGGSYPAQAAGGAGADHAGGQRAAMARQSSDQEVRQALKSAVITRLQEQLRSRYETLSKAADDTAVLGETLVTRQASAGNALAALQERQAVLTAYLADVKARAATARTWLERYEAPAAAAGGGGASAGAGAGAGRGGSSVAGRTDPRDISDHGSVSSAGNRSGAGGGAGGRGGWAAGAGGASGAGSVLIGGDRDRDRDGLLDAVMPTSVLSRQLLLKVAEDVALEDYLPHIDEALANGRIRPEEAVQEVRDVARRQFQARALAKKIDRALEEQARRTAELHRQYASPVGAAGGGFGGAGAGPGAAQQRLMGQGQGSNSPMPGTPSTPAGQLGQDMRGLYLGQGQGQGQGRGGV